MADRPVPKINYDFTAADGHNVFRERFGSLTDHDWGKLLVRSINEPVIDGVHFPLFPEEELQTRIHGAIGVSAIEEAMRFFAFVKQHTYAAHLDVTKTRLLDFGCGWGRIVRCFLRDFEFKNIFAFEPNFLYVTLARSLNPYVTFLAGSFDPVGDLPGEFFNLVTAYSIFSHLTEDSTSAWLTEMARIVVPGGQCVFTTFGDRLLKIFQKSADERAAGKEIHWHHARVIDSAGGSMQESTAAYERGDFVWLPGFAGSESTLNPKFGEAFISEVALTRLIAQHSLPFSVTVFSKETLPQDTFVLQRL